MTSAVTVQSGETRVRARKTLRRDVHRVLDIFCWAVAIFGAYLIHYDFVVTPLQAIFLLLLVAISSVAQLLFGWAFFLYRRRFSTGSFDEIRALWKSGMATGAILLLTGIITGYFADHSAALGLIITPAAMTLMFGVRYGERLRRLARSNPDGNAARTLVIGAGEIGTR